MREPYQSYINERAANLAATLNELVGETNLQLCPRAILDAERYFDDSSALIYGCVVDRLEDGEKSALYLADDDHCNGTVVWQTECGLDYAQQIIQAGNQVRLKDPRESDGRGQVTASTLQEVKAALQDHPSLETNGMVVMPHLVEVTDRVSIGRIRLGPLGTYAYIGREFVTRRNESDVYAGADLAVVNNATTEGLKTAADQLGIDPKSIDLARGALLGFEKLALHVGRVSVDILSGRVDNGDTILTVVDLTPRIGNNTPPEVEAIKALRDNGAQGHVAHVRCRLHYDPTDSNPPAGVRYIDTNSLIATTTVTDLASVRTHYS